MSKKERVLPVNKIKEQPKKCGKKQLKQGKKTPTLIVKAVINNQTPNTQIEIKTNTIIQDMINKIKNIFTIKSKRYYILALILTLASIYGINYTKTNKNKGYIGIETGKNITILETPTSKITTPIQDSIPNNSKNSDTTTINLNNIPIKINENYLNNLIKEINNTKNLSPEMKIYKQNIISIIQNFIEYNKNIYNYTNPYSIINKQETDILINNLLNHLSEIFDYNNGWKYDQFEDNETIKQIIDNFCNFGILDTNQFINNNILNQHKILLATNNIYQENMKFYKTITLTKGLNFSFNNPELQKGFNFYKYIYNPQNSSIKFDSIPSFLESNNLASQYIPNQSFYKNIQTFINNSKKSPIGIITLHGIKNDILNNNPKDGEKIIDGIENISKTTKIPADRITIAMKFESNYNPQSQNLSTYSTGLIQLLPSTLDKLYQKYKNKFQNYNFKTKKEIKQEVDSIFKNPDGTFKTDSNFTPAIQLWTNHRKNYYKYNNYKNLDSSQIEQKIQNKLNYYKKKYPKSWKKIIENQTVNFQHTAQITSNLNLQFLFTSLYFDNAKTQIKDPIGLGVFIFGGHTLLNQYNKGNYTYIIAKKGQEAYTKNKGLDKDNKGYINLQDLIKAYKTYTVYYY